MSGIRLIDANALKEKINAFYDKLFVGCVSSDLITYASGVDGIIDNAPTVEPERPTGKWLHKEFDPFLKEYGQCSNCLQRERVGNFCRNCGADMRGGDK